MFIALLEPASATKPGLPHSQLMKLLALKPFSMCMLSIFVLDFLGNLKSFNLDLFFLPVADSDK